MANPPNQTQPPPLKPAANAYFLQANLSQVLVQPPNPAPNRAQPEPQPVVIVPPSISGQVTHFGSPFPSVPIEVTNNGTVFTDTNGNYSVTVALGFSGNTIPHWPTGAFTPTSRVYSNLQTSQTGQNFTFVDANHTISGTITQNGTGMNLIPVEFSGAGTVFTNSSGFYTESIVDGYTGSSIPHWFGGTFNPTTRNYSVVTSDQTSQNFQFFGTSASVSIHISGTVTQSGTGILASIEVQGNGTVSTSATGSYGFDVNSPFSGTTIPHVGVGTNGSFIPVDYVYVNASTNQTNQNFSFVANTDCPIPQTLAAITVNGTAKPTIFSLNPTTHELLVLDDNNPTVYFIDATTMAVKQVLDTGNGAFVGNPCAVFDSLNNQWVVMTYNGDILFISTSFPHAVTNTITNVIRHPNFHMLAYDPVTGHSFATSYRDTGFPNGLMRVIDGATHALISSGTNPVAPDSITWVPTLNRVYIAKVGLGAPLFTLFNPTGLSYANSVITADTNFNYECFFHPPTGNVLHSRDGANPSRIVDPIGGSIVASFDPQRLADVVVNTCTGETWVSDGNTLIFELDATGTLATVAAYNTKPNNLAFDRKTNLLYYDNYSTHQIVTLPTTSQSDPFFGLDQYGFTTFGNIGGITAITFNNILSIPGFDIESNTEITTLSFPFLTEVDPNNFQGGYVTVLSNTSLTSLTMPVWMPTPGISYEFGTNALTAASVNGILARGVANGNFTSGSMNFGGGTNAKPTGQGLTDAATLKGRGVGIQTN